jgi:2-ketocyclohexanecarboxyl-CoA hydrolase
MAYSDILYEKDRGVAQITINRPHRMNAFTSLTLEEMIDAIYDATYDREVGVVVLTGAGDRAFTTGGDQEDKSEGQYVQHGKLDTMDANNQLIYLIRNIPKPVIAMVNGYAIGGGHVIHVVCDLSIASETAIFGQVGPKVGSFDAGFGAAYLARVVGEKKAREIWYLCRRYSAREALEMGLVNAVVPPAQLQDETRKWCDEILAKSPAAIAFMKAGFNADSDQAWGLQNFYKRTLRLYYDTDESQEGRAAFLEKRPPDFGRYRRGAF